MWPLLDEPEQLGEWFAFADGGEVLEGKGVGRRRRKHGHWGSKPSEVDQVVVEHEPPRRLAWRHEAERLDGRPAPRFAAQTLFTASRWSPSTAGTTRATLRSAQVPARTARGGDARVRPPRGRPDAARSRSSASIRELGAAARPRRELSVDDHAGQPVQADDLDQALDLRLGAADAQLAARPGAGGGRPWRGRPSATVGERSSRRSTRRSLCGRGRGEGAGAATASRVLVPGQRRIVGCSQNVTMAGTYPTAAATLNICRTLEEVEDALTNVIDPELGLDFVELGPDLRDRGRRRPRPRHVHADDAGLPDRSAGDRADRGVRLRARRRRRASIHMTFTPPWTPDKMSEDAKFALGY